MVVIDIEKGKELICNLFPEVRAEDFDFFYNQAKSEAASYFSIEFGIGRSVTVFMPDYDYGLIRNVIFEDKSCGADFHLGIDDLLSPEKSDKYYFNNKGCFRRFIQKYPAFPHVAYENEDGVIGYTCKGEKVEV